MEDLIRLLQYDGHTRIFVVPDLQYVMIENVLTDKTPTIQHFKFMGDEFDGKHLRHEGNPLINGKFPGIEKEFKGHVVYAHVNYQVFTPDQLKGRAWFNMGDANEPMIFEVFYACPQYTGASLVPNIDDDLRYILNSLPNRELRKNWKRIYIDDVGQFFVE
jgi:hypothetical protein